MKTQTKLIIGLGIVGVAIYLIANKNSKSSSVLKLMDDDTTLTAISNLNVCDKGMLPCSNNNTRCYDPKVDYAIDPCRVIVDNNF
jgi:hypothetical protein